MKAFVPFALLVCAAATAQNNLCKNGDFETNSLAPWTIVSGATKLRIVSGISCASRVDRALEISGAATVRQRVTVPADGSYQVSFSARRSNFNDRATLRIVESMPGAAVLQKGAWCPVGHLVETGRPFALKKGTYTLELDANATRLYVDELILRPVGFPTLYYSDTTFGQSALRRFFVTHDRDAAVVVPIASNFRLSKAITLPTFTGEFWLDPWRGYYISMQSVVSKKDQQQVVYQLPFALPKGLDVGLYLQSIDLSGRSFGNRLYVHFRG